MNNALSLGLAFCLAVGLQVTATSQQPVERNGKKKIGTLNGKPLLKGRRIEKKDLYAVRPDGDPDKMLDIWNRLIGSIHSIGTCDVFVAYRSSRTSEHVDDVLEELAKYDKTMYVGRCRLNFDIDCYRWDWWQLRYVDRQAFEDLNATLQSLAKGDAVVKVAEALKAEATHTGYIVTPEYAVDRSGQRVTLRLPTKKYVEWPSVLDVRLAGWVKPAQLRLPTSFPQWINVIQLAYRPYALERLDRDLFRLTWFRKRHNDVQQFDVRPTKGYALFRIVHSKAFESKGTLYVEKDFVLDAVLFQERRHGRHLTVRTVTKSDKGVEEFRLHWKSVNRELPGDPFGEQSLKRSGDRFVISRECRAMTNALTESFDDTKE